MLNAFARGKQRWDAAERLYAALVSRDGEPVFFARLAASILRDGPCDPAGSDVALEGMPGRGIETPAATAIASYIGLVRASVALARELDFRPLPGEECV